ncbi:hypothetical protein TNIN_124011 [Trichonephila inaurata madagascariensis]|uniref:Uncharacterized protein n=1 Tax=Trichonephila inaurata madagascariensis TaxID=2747483 RepID=A0A8X6XIT0_9ARAC|nr:hypothetical protein TNIN_124011 [Trichonephila inaurata madagascariensis]
MRASIEQSPKRPTLKHAAALGLSNRSVRKILYRDLHMHPYKMMNYFPGKESSGKKLADWFTADWFHQELIGSLLIFSKGMEGYKVFESIVQNYLFECPV